MALVSYSDSETSDVEAEPAVPASKHATTKPSKPLFEKVVDRSESGTRKIKLDLPTPKPEAALSETQDTAGPPQKRARTAGAFSSFNNLLPAPKRAAQNGPKLGVNLKTSSEAAFSRNVPEAPALKQRDEEDHTDATNSIQEANGETKLEEPKIVGKTTRFMPLSVASNKRKPRPKLPVVDDTPKTSNNQERVAASLKSLKDTAQPAPVPKRSLFSVTNENIVEEPKPRGSTYEPIMSETDIDTQQISAEPPAPAEPQALHTTTPTPSHSLEAVASDLNLTPAQRRQLFGRRKAGDDVQIAHFNTEAEYAANEQLRQAGEAVEHKAVKAIAPGKHSLQQLVNNAKSQQDAMEEKWAAGRSARGEGGSKYGF